MFDETRLSKSGLPWAVSYFYCNADYGQMYPANPIDKKSLLKKETWFKQKKY